MSEAAKSVDQVVPVHRRVPRPIGGLIAIAGLVLGLQIPIAMIRELIDERVDTRGDALAEVTATWGGSQSLVGPRLEIPFRQGTSATGVEQLAHASFLPEELFVDGDIRARSLARGLFDVPVYDAELRLRGRFGVPDFDALGIDEEAVLWERAVLVVELSDPKAVGAASSSAWRGAPVTLRPGGGASGRAGIHAPVDAEDPAAFSLDLSVRGSSALWLVPFARDTRVTLASDWADPSFAGAWLPSRREVDAAGFAASWQIPFLGRDYPQAWLDGAEPYEHVVASRFGVTLVSPVDHYRMAERSTKYAPLFLVLTFGLLWLVDVMVGIRVHPVQLLLIGTAMCLFYLLELSLGEHVGFVPAYMVAAGSVVLLVAGYSGAVLRSRRRGVAAAALLSGLYAYLLTLLSLEEYALLAGSLGLFTILAATMYLTRWVNWDDLVRAQAPIPE